MPLDEDTRTKAQEVRQERGKQNAIVCIFDYSEGKICCSDGETVQCCWAFSGNGDDKNNPESQHKEDKGPLPVGEWLIGEKRTDKTSCQHWRKLYHKEADGRYKYNGIRVGSATRGEFNLHGCMVSNGCLTVDCSDRRNNPNTECYGNSGCLEELNNLLNQGSYRYKNSGYAGFLYVQE